MSDGLAINGGEPVLAEGFGQFDWPRITPDMERAVLAQLHESISIYDSSGIFGKFESAFARLHGREYGLLFSSGTAAIFAMYDAVGVSLGSEVLCPVYTFHATVSPLAMLGAIPKFCDVDDFGNVSASSVAKRIGPDTKAVIVTHMWGTPCDDIVAIRSICDDYGVPLLEDCSHAHGARIDRGYVGTFGDAAAWSLQGQKTLTGGEGGILCTSSQDIQERAILLGHYNKRAKTEIRRDSPLHDFYLTGLGLKLRAHPLAVAIAMCQLDTLEGLIQQRGKYARILTDVVADYDFLSVAIPPGDVTSSYYALPLKFDEVRAGVSRDWFVKALHAEGLSEMDIPGSTGLLNDLPLFRSPNMVLPHLFPEPLAPQDSFPAAQDFVNRFFKMPVWGYVDEIPIVEGYAAGLEKVCAYVNKHKSHNV